VGKGGQNHKERRLEQLKDKGPLKGGKRSHSDGNHIWGENKSKMGRGRKVGKEGK